MKLDFPHNPDRTTRDIARGRYAALVAKAANRQLGNAALAGRGVPASSAARSDALASRIGYFCGLSRRDSGIATGAFLPDVSVSPKPGKIGEPTVYPDASANGKVSFLDSDQPEQTGCLAGHGKLRTK